VPRSFAFFANEWVSSPPKCFGLTINLNTLGLLCTCDQGTSSFLRRAAPAFYNCLGVRHFSRFSRSGFHCRLHRIVFHHHSKVPPVTAVVRLRDLAVLERVRWRYQFVVAGMGSCPRISTRDRRTTDIKSINSHRHIRSIVINVLDRSLAGMQAV
jgi:hypothetical protein